MSLHKEFSASRLDPLDFARAAAGLRIDAVEYAARFYPGRASDRSYLAELKRRAVGEGVASLLISVDDEGLGAPMPKARKRAVERHEKWVEAAALAI
jgi:L-ribulose-5-phosphate 3-epimerase